MDCRRLRDCCFSVLTFAFLFLALLGCQQTPTLVSQLDQNFVQRRISKISSNKEEDLKRAVFIDVRSRFDFEMSKLPRSFHALWKDWDLRDYSGQDRLHKAVDLQRFLARQGIDPLTRVVILGYGLKGKGDEFLLAHTLLMLGIENIQFLPVSAVERALSSRDVPAMESIEYWSKPVIEDPFECSIKKTKFDYVITSETSSLVKVPQSLYQIHPSDFLLTDLGERRFDWIKSRSIHLFSKDNRWPYAAALYLSEQGREVCVHGAR